MMNDIIIILMQYFERYHKLMNEVELYLRELKNKGDFLNK